MMKIVRLGGWLVLAGALAGCLENSGLTPGTSATVLYRHHFVGSSQLARGTNKLATILALPASHELGGRVLERISSSPQELWHKFLPPGGLAAPALVRPLLDDLWRSESYAETRGPLDKGESVFAIALSEERAGLWRTNLGAILTSWRLGTPKPSNPGEPLGWQLRRTESPNLIQFVRTGQWALVGLGPERLTLLPAWAEQIKKSGRPAPAQPNTPLELDADIPRLSDWLPALAQTKLPPVHLVVMDRGDHLRTEARLEFSEPLPWAYEPWKIPTNAITDPIVSFTVGRGVAPLLSRIKGVPALGINPLPNQFCLWGPGTAHANTFIGMPVANAARVLHQLGPGLPDLCQQVFSEPLGGFTLVSNRNELLWRGWPVLQPYLLPVRDQGTDYLMGGLLPMRPSTNPAPPELFAQLKGRTNLVYYDWEITQERVKHSRQLQQLYDIMTHRRSAPTNSPSSKWLQAIGPHLGNTITEATLSSPRGLTIVRRSDCGFTGFELATLARYSTAPGFPWNFDLPRLFSTRTNSPPVAPALKAGPAGPRKK